MRSSILSIPGALVLLGALVPLGALAQEQEMKVLVNFTEQDEVRWRIVNDGVMGGRSSSDIDITAEGTALFSGFLSMENNGGFASVRGTFQSLDLSAYRGVTLRVRGDGRRYQLRFRMDGSYDGVAWQSEFATVQGEWIEIELPFETFQPSFRGRIPRGAGPLDPARIRQMTFFLGDKDEGPFSLEVAWVKTMQQGESNDQSNR